MNRFLFLLLLLPHAVLGQPNDTTATAPFPTKNRYKFSLMAEFGFTNAYTSLPVIRSFFRENQIKADSRFNNFIATAVGFRRNRLKFMLIYAYGIDNRALPSTEPASQALVARRQNVGHTGLLLGYDLVNTRNNRLYLNVGAGNSRYEYSIYRRGSQAVNFQNILQTESSGTIPSLMLDNGYWDVHIEYSLREKRRDGPQFVSRIGYRRGWRPSAWTSEAYQIVGGPLDRISQVYAHFGIYIAHNYNRHSKR